MLVTKLQEHGDTSRFGVLRGGTGDTAELRCSTFDPEEGIHIRPMKTVCDAAALSTSAIPFAVWFGVQNLNKSLKSLNKDLGVQATGLNDKAGKLVREAKALNHGLNNKAGQLVREAKAHNNKAGQLVGEAKQLVARADLIAVYAGQMVWTFQVIGFLGLLLGYTFLFKSILKW
jgi:hypothetical protein